MERDIRTANPPFVRKMERYRIGNNRMLSSESSHLLYKLDFPMVGFLIFPIKPAGGVILTVGVIITVLGISHLIPRPQERYPLGQKQHHDTVPEPLASLAVHVCLTGRSLHAAVTAEVPVTAIQIVLSVRLIVLVIVHKQICQRKTIISRYEINEPQLLPLLALLVQKFPHIRILMI